MIECVYLVSVVLEFRYFDTKSFRYKSTRYKLKSFRYIIKVDSIHVESRFDSTQPLCSQLFTGPNGVKIAITVRKPMKMLPSAHSYASTFNTRFF